MADISRITERLFIGANLTTADDLRAVKEAGVTSVIDTVGTAWDNAKPMLALKGWGWSYLDTSGEVGSTAWFQPCILLALAVFSIPGLTVLVHCADGVGKSPAIVYAILRAQGFPPTLASMRIKFKRPQVIERGILLRDQAEYALEKLGWCKPGDDDQQSARGTLT